ncbi:MAG: TetR/AcrR family transcriptional regulator [bacterium]|jgi:AcrR family transcriptional regulator
MAVSCSKINKRKAILTAARQVFAAMGFHQARIEDIAREAGVGKGTVYEYFSSKEQLYTKMIFEVADSYITGVDTEISKEVTLPGKLAGIARFHLQFIAQHGQLAEMAMQDPGHINQTLRKRLAQVSKQVIQRVAEIIGEAMDTGQFRSTDPVLAAKLFLGGLSNVINPMGAHEGKVAPDTLNMIVDLFLHGITKGEG